MEPATYTLSSEIMADIRKAFAKCDPNNTGKIHRDDLGTVMRALGFNHTESELYRYVEELDEEYTGNIEFETFVNLMRRTYEFLDQKEFLLNAFKVFDRENDGFITYSKLRNMFTSLGEKITDEEFDVVFREVDIDGDGVINLRDFFEAYRT